MREGTCGSLLAVNLLEGIGGLALVGATAADAISTLVTTRRRVGRFWPNRVFYLLSWRAWSALARRSKDSAHREIYLSVYGPLSILGLLVTWLLLLLIGWALVWYSLRDVMHPEPDFVEAIYFAGIGFFTVGFGDFVPVGEGARILSVVQAFMGVTTMALVISYLPTLYGAFSRREVQLLDLDYVDASGQARATPIGFITAYTVDGDLAPLYSELEEWSDWCAEIIDSHGAYPMLVYFRSRRPGQSWLTALAIVTDASAVLMACVADLRAPEPARMFRRASEMLRDIPTSATIEPSPDAPNVMALFETAYERLGELGLELRPHDEARAALRELRQAYLPQIDALTRHLMVPQYFRTEVGPLLPGEPAA
jgi:hypothetical protein